MKKLLSISIFICAFSIGYAQTNQLKNSEKASNNEIVLLDVDDNTDRFIKSEEIYYKLTYSLNYAGKEKIKAMALDKIKELAFSKGYTHLLIDQEASFRRQNEIRKRNYTVLVTGKAFN